MERLLLECSVRMMLVAAATAAILWLLRVRTAPARHAVWTGVLALMLLLPVWTMWGPKAALRVLPAPAFEQSAFATEDVTAPAVAVQEFRETRPAVVASNWDWPPVLLGLYLIGTGWLLARLAIGTMRARRLTSAECVAPITVGLLKPRIILPQGWESWPREQLEAVVTHERAHARRRDPLVQWLALLNRAIFWFHPLAWWLERKLAALAEEACDAAVLEGGHDAGEYAECLLAMERNVSRAGIRLAIGMAMPGSALPERIKQIFEGARPTRMSRSRLAFTALACAASAAMFAAGTLEHMPQMLPLSPMPAMRMPQVPVLLAQTAKAPAAAAPAPVEKLEFETASVRPAAPGQGRGRGGNGPGGMRLDPGMMIATNTDLKEIFRVAYKLKDYQVSGPDWLASATYDMTGKSATRATPDELRVMLRKLLADRFHLRFHIETKPMEVMALVVAKGGPKFHEAQEARATNDETMAFTGPMGMGPFYRNISFDTLIIMLSGACGTLEIPFGPVVDMTGLKGDYDLRMQTRPNPDSGPRTAMDQLCEATPQLGLEFKREKVPIEMYVIDSADKVPTQN